jgi:hypothetical protein
VGGAGEDWDRISNTGVMGLRGEVSMLKGGKDLEAGPYFGVGIGDDGPGLILGYDYRKYTGQSSGSPKKLGAQIEVNFGEAGQTLHLRPSITSTTRRGKPFYGGVHGLLAMGNLMDRFEWETYDSSGYGDVSEWTADWYSHDYEEEEIDYTFNSLGAGITAGTEFLTFANNSIQLQVDVSLVKNSFNTDAEPPDIDMENVIWTSWDEDDGEERWGSHDDDPALMVTGSIGMSFFKPDPKMIAPLEPFPVPSYRPLAQPPEKIIYDPETGLPVPSEPEMEFDPETGEMIQKDTETRYDPETGERIKTNREIIHDPETGMQNITPYQAEELSYGELVFQAQNAAKRLHNKGLFQSCGAGSCVIYPIGIPAAILYVETGAFSNLNLYDPFYLDLNTNQKIVYKSAYKKEEKKLRRKAIYNTQLGCIVAFFGLMIMG